MLRVLLVVPLALLAVIPSASAAEAQRWQGMTSQGLAMDFVVKKAGGKTVIASWEFEFTLLCLKSGNIIDLFTGFDGFDIPVVHERFTFTELDPFQYFSWKGAFTRPKDARGSAISDLPALTRKIQGEVCTSGRPSWEAHPASGPIGARPHVQMWIRLVKGSDGKVTRSVSS